MRWNHPTKGVTGPDLFIPYAESSGLISRISEFVMNDSANLMNSLKKIGYEDIKVSINISSYQFMHDDLIEIFKNINHIYHLSHRLIVTGKQIGRAHV